MKDEINNLMIADDQAGSFLETATVRPISAHISDERCLAEGEIVSERFEIGRFLGQGGMGQVYEARDLELQERIALKTIHREISSDSHVLSRFKREIQLTRRVTHPNVCRTFDLARCTRPSRDFEDRKDDITFITMELLEGETLTERLRRAGPIEISIAFQIAKQITEGLSAAHDAGVIHRDLKPSNIVLVSTGEEIRAVVTDFGLARAVSPVGEAAGLRPSGSFTASGNLIGTLAYMAPEQLQGGTTTRATDIYALGLVLYEMVTGSKPFANDIPFAMAMQRLTQKPLSPRAHFPQIDQRWEITILRCLEIDPQKRYQTAREVAASLEGSKPLASQPTRLTPAFRFAVLYSRIKESILPQLQGSAIRRLSLIFFLLLAFLGAVVRLSILKVQQVHVPEGSLVMLAGVSNESGDPDLNGTTELLRDQLSQSAYMNVLGQEHILEALHRMGRRDDEGSNPSVAREVALRSGAPLVIFGTVSRIAEDFKLDLKLERVAKDPGHARASWTFGEAASSKKDLSDAIRHGGLWIRGLIGEAKTAIEERDRRPEDVTTNNWNALRLYSEGQQFAAKDELDKAILLYKQAAANDPDFAMALMRAGDSLDTLGRYDEGYAYWQRALAVSGLRKLTDREELRIKGMMASDSGNLRSAIDLFGQYSIAYPNDYLGFFYRGYPLMMLGNTEEAIATLEEAERRSKSSYYIVDHLARYYLILGNFPESSRYTEIERKLGHSENADLVDGQAHYMKGEYDTASQLFTGLQNSGDQYLQSVSYYNLACILAEKGLYNRAISILEQGINADAISGAVADRANKLLAIAYLYLKKGNREASREAALKSLDIENSLRRRADAGTILARGGWVRDAKRLLNSFSSRDFLPLSDTLRLRLRGEIMLAEGHRSTALSALQEWREKNQERAFLHDSLVKAQIAANEFEDAIREIDAFRQRPGQVWHQPEMYPPGEETDLLFLYARVGLRLGTPDARDALAKYVQRRQGADPDILDVIEAKSLLRVIGQPPS